MINTGRRIRPLTDATDRAGFTSTDPDIPTSRPAYDNASSTEASVAVFRGARTLS
jgi:hypothetical protein